MRKKLRLKLHKKVEDFPCRNQAARKTKTVRQALVPIKESVMLRGLGSSVVA